MTPEMPSEPSPPVRPTPEAAPEPSPETTPGVPLPSPEGAVTDAPAPGFEAEGVPISLVGETTPLASDLGPGEVSSGELPVASSSAPETPGPVLASPQPEQPKSFIQRTLPWFKKVGSVLERLSVAGVFIFLLRKSWMRWPDPFIDFPRDLYIAWRISVGDALYNLNSYHGTGHTVASWYGPLAHLVEAAGFRIFGVGMDTVVWMNVALSVVVLLFLRGIFGAIGNRLSVWLCSMTFLLVFFVGHLVGIGNYNFITPYVAQTTYGFAGLLLLLWALLGHLRSDWGWWLWLAGVGLGVAYLDKPEPLLAAGGALGVYGALRLLQRFRQVTPGGGWRGAFKLLWTSTTWVAIGFLAAWVPVFVYFLIKGGMGYALRATNWVIYTMMAGTYLKTVANSTLYASLYGFDRPLQNFLIHLQVGALLLLICGLMVGASRAWARAQKFSFWWWFGPVVLLMAGGLGAWLGEHLDNWMGIGMAFNFSLTFLVVILVGWCAWAAWRDDADFERALGLTVVGTAALLMLVRMILFGRIFQYGFFMAPLAALFIIHLVVYEGARTAEGQRRRNWLLPVVFGAITLYSGLAVTGVSLQRYAQKTYAVGTGRDRFYTFQPQPPKAEPGVIYAEQGLILETMLEEAHKNLPKVRTLVAFPESAAVNYHLRVPSPVPEVEFHPTGLGFVGPQQVADAIKANPPDAVFLYMRDMREFGVLYFGYDEGSGKAILDWLAANYVAMWNAGPHSQFLNNDSRYPLTPTGDAIDLLVPNPALAPSASAPLPTPDQLLKNINLK